jgi:hypothetical protein
MWNFKNIIREQLHSFEASPAYAMTQHVFISLATPTYGILDEILSETFEHVTNKTFHTRLRPRCDKNDPVTLPDDEQLDEMYQRVGADKYVLAFESDEPHVYEYPALLMMHRYCKRHTDDIVWYMHTKGATLRGNSDSWRHYMQYFLHFRGPDWCVPLLSNRSVDSCGVNYRVSPFRHFSGNFWWASCRLVNRCQEIRNPFLIDHWWVRLGAESWLLRAENAEPLVLCLHNSFSISKHKDLNHYEEDYPRDRYENSSLGENCPR